MRTAEQTYYKLLIACNPEASITVHSIISLKQLTDCYAPHKEPLKMFKEVFGEEAWTYNNKASVFGDVNGCAESFVRDAYAGHMCIYRDCKAFLHDFAEQKGKYGIIINKVTGDFRTRIENSKITITDEKIQNVKKLAKSWKSLFIDESEKGNPYRSSVSQEIYKSAKEILSAVYDLFQEEMTPHRFSMGIVALGFFSICFLTFTERAYQHCKENYSVPFQTIQNGLISLLEAVKTFLCPEQPEQSERKNFSMQEHTKTAESTSNAGKPKPHPSGKSASRIRNGFIASKYWDEMIAKMPCIDNTEALKNLIKRKVEEYVDALSLRKLLKDGDIKCMCDDLHIGVNTRYAPIIALLARCAVVLNSSSICAAVRERCSSSISEETDKEATKLYKEWYKEAIREAKQYQNDEQEVSP